MSPQRRPGIAPPDGVDCTALASQLLTHSGEIAVLVDAGGDVRWVSSAWHVVTGWDAADAIGKPHDEHVAEDDRDRVALVGSPPPAYGPSRRFRLRHRVGRWVELASRGTVLAEGGADGEPLHLLVWREAAAVHGDLSFHIDNSPMALIELDAEIRIRRYSLQAQRMLGYSAEQVLGKTLLDIGLIESSDEQDIADTLFATLIEEGLDRGVERITLRRSSGELIETEWHVSALRDEQRSATSFLALGQDITERRRREDALRHTQKLESVGVLAGGVAHDFNNLLTSVLGHAGLAMRSRELPPGVFVHLDRIQEAAERAAELTKQLLAYAGQGRIMVRDVDINGLAAGMSELFAASISKSATMHYDLVDGVVAVEGDTSQLQQLLLNLVTNAGEALPDGLGDVTLRTRSVVIDEDRLQSDFAGSPMEPGPFMELTVSDNGVGLDADALGRVFDPFFTTRETGRGLGLAAVAGIVRSHHGGIRLESEAGRGTTFRVYLPLTSSRLEVSESQVSAGSARATKCILVVDDESVVRSLMGDILGTQGYRVIYACDGRECLEVFKARHSEIDLIILDLTMPVMDGVETFHALMAEEPQVRVLLASGYSRQEVIDRFDGRGPTAFIQKPFRIADILATLEEALA